METSFIISTHTLAEPSRTDRTINTPYLYFSFIAEWFIGKLADIIRPHGYDIEMQGMAGGGEIEPWTTTFEEAKRLKYYSKDFQIILADGSARSRTYRIESKMNKKSTPLIGVLDEMKPKRNKWRDTHFASPGKVKFLGDYSQKITEAGIKMTLNRFDTFQTHKSWYFKVVVNEDMVLVFGSDQINQTANKIYSNYLSFVKSYSLEKPGKARWITNGMTGIATKQITVDRLVTQKKPNPYARIGLIFKCSDEKGSPLEWICPRINMLPSIRSYANPNTDEPFTVLFNNDFNNRSPNKVFYMNSISMLQTKPCMILT